MGVDPVSLAVGSGIVKGVGGAVKGAKGTPDQVTTTQNSTAPAGAQEQALQAQSLQNYMQANNLAGQYEGGQGSAQNYQDLARQAGGNILNGSAFNVTPEEQQRVQGLRDALFQQGSQDINYNTQQGLQNVLAGAGGRGLRGQALGSLQGQVLDSANRNIAGVSNNANTIAAQAYLAAPQQRIAAQQANISQGLSLGDMLRQQAINNRQALQDPALMRYLQLERSNNRTTQTTNPGQRGGIGDALAGGFGGFQSGLESGTAMTKGLGDLRAYADALAAKNKQKQQYQMNSQANLGFGDINNLNPNKPFWE